MRKEQRTKQVETAGSTYKGTPSISLCLSLGNGNGHATLHTALDGSNVGASLFALAFLLLQSHGLFLPSPMFLFFFFFSLSSRTNLD